MASNERFARDAENPRVDEKLRLWDSTVPIVGRPRSDAPRKSQIPNPKLQTNFKIQIPKSVAAEFEIWDLRFAWDLELGIWDFLFGKPQQRFASRAGPIRQGQRAAVRF